MLAQYTMGSWNTGVLLADRLSNAAAWRNCIAAFGKTALSEGAEERLEGRIERKKDRCCQCVIGRVSAALWAESCVARLITTERQVTWEEPSQDRYRPALGLGFWYRDLSRYRALLWLLAIALWRGPFGWVRSSSRGMLPAKSFGTGQRQMEKFAATGASGKQKKIDTGRDLY